MVLGNYCNVYNGLGMLSALLYSVGYFEWFCCCIAELMWCLLWLWLCVEFMYDLGMSLHCRIIVRLVDVLAANWMHEWFVLGWHGSRILDMVADAVGLPLLIHVGFCCGWLLLVRLCFMAWKGFSWLHKVHEWLWHVVLHVPCICLMYCWCVHVVFMFFSHGWIRSCMNWMLCRHVQLVCYELFCCAFYD